MQKSFLFPGCGARRWRGAGFFFRSNGYALRAGAPAAWGRFFLSVKWLCAPRGPERRAGFFFELVLALVARGMFFFRSNGLRSARARGRAGFFFKLVRALVARGMFFFRSNGFALRAGQRQGGVFRIPPPYLWTPLSPQRVKGCSPLTSPKKKSKRKKASRCA